MYFLYGGIRHIVEVAFGEVRNELQDFERPTFCKQILANHTGVQHPS